MKTFYLCVIASLFFLPGIVIGQEAVAAEEYKQYDYWFAGFGVGYSTDFDRNAAITTDIGRLNFFVGRQFSERFGIIWEVLDFGPRIETDPNETNMNYISSVVNFHYYIVPDQAVSIFVGAGIALSGQNAFTHAPVSRRDTNARHQPTAKFGVSAAPSFMRQFLRIEVGYQQNLGATRREVGADRVYRFGYMSLNLQYPFRN